MNALRSKEIRLMRPAYIMALALAIVPMWLLTAKAIGSTDILKEVAAYSLGFGLVVLALSCFGREFSLNTFPVLLAQPLERQRIWRTKITVLATAMITIFGVWIVSWIMRVLFLHAVALDPGAWANKVFDSFLFAFAATTTLVVFSGGLWTTLLLRQVTAPFWFTVLLPATIVMVVDLCGGSATVIYVALMLYSVAGFWLARRLFFNAQETAWTGGIFVLPGLRSKGVAKISEIRSRRPWMAMIRKEFQLHQVGLAGIAILFVVHLGTLLFHHGGLENKLARTASTISDLCSMLWCVAPLFIGATSVAEERKMGVAEAHLCLPMSSRWQVAIKLAFVVIFGGLLSALLLWTKSHIGHSMLGMSDYVELKLGDRTESLTILSALLTGLALLAFYGSTLSRNLMQALVNAVAALLTVLGLNFLVNPPYGSWLNNNLPWNGDLIYFIAVPTLVIALVCLSYRNFRQLPDARRIWRRNAIGWVCALLFAGTATAGLYNRVWEYLTPLEPAHGPARLNISEPPSLADDVGGRVLSALLPDGRIWESRIGHHPNWGFHLVGHPYSLGVGGNWSSLAEKPFVEGSNWVDAVAGNSDTAAIRSDGTLWVSSQPRSRFAYERNGRIPSDQRDTLIQHGRDADWKSIVALGGTEAMLLLKTDGSLWRWESWSFDWRKPWVGMRSFQPYRLGSTSGWANLMSATGEHSRPGEAWLYIWDKSGQAWALNDPFSRSRPTNAPIGELAPGKGLERKQVLDNSKWRSVTGWSPQWAPFDVGVREDGTLWMWDALLNGNPDLPVQFRGKIAQMGSGANWVAVASTHFGEAFVALKADGTLWRWEYGNVWNAGNQLIWPAAILPAQMGTHNDWVAVCGALGGNVSLAADGSLWLWCDRPYWENGELLIPPSKKPAKLCNIFDQE